MQHYLRNKCMNRYSTIHSGMLISCGKRFWERGITIFLKWKSRIHSFADATVFTLALFSTSIKYIILWLDQNQRVNNLLQNNRFRNYLQLNLTCNGCSLNVYYDTDSSKQVHFTDKFIIVYVKMKIKLYEFNPQWQC